MLQTSTFSLKHLFNDHDYAWQLLEGEAHLEVSDCVTSQDVSNLLQLYMKGVEKMNSVLDLREAFFKERVIRLMTRPTVMKTLNNNQILSKKNITQRPPLAKEQKKQASSSIKKSDKIISSKRIQAKPELLQLKQKKMEIEVRLAYEVKQNTPDLLHNMILEQRQKQDSINQKINKMFEDHEDQLLKRIQERKQKNISKSLFNVSNKNNQIDLSSKDLFVQKNREKLKEKLDRIIQSSIELERANPTIYQKEKGRRRFKSEVCRTSIQSDYGAKHSPKGRISVNLAEQVRGVKEKQKQCQFNQL